MMPYDEALRRWGINQLISRHPGAVFDESTVEVKMDFNEGYACCNGTDPDCYCSFAESPSSDVSVTAELAEDYDTAGTWSVRWSEGTPLEWTQSAEDFDFAEMVRELFEIAKED